MCSTVRSQQEFLPFPPILILIEYEKLKQGFAQVEDIDDLADVARSSGYRVIVINAAAVSSTPQMKLSAKPASALSISKTSCLEAAFAEGEGGPISIHDRGYSANRSPSGVLPDRLKLNFKITGAAGAAAAVEAAGAAGAAPAQKKKEVEKLPNLKLIRDENEHMCSKKYPPFLPPRNLPQQPATAAPLLVQIFQKEKAIVKHRTSLFVFFSAESSGWSVGHLLGAASKREHERFTETWGREKKPYEEGTAWRKLGYLTYDMQRVTTVCEAGDIDANHQQKLLFFIDDTKYDFETLAEGLGS